MRFNSRSVFLFSALTLCAAGSPAQQSVAVSAKPADKVYLDVVVTPKSGVSASGLQAGDFSVLDNEVTRPISSFSSDNEREAPTEVILLLDAANARYQTVSDERQQVSKFLLSHDGVLAYPTTLAVLTDTGTQIQKSGTRDGKALNTILASYTVGLRSIRQSAGFYGAAERQQVSLRALSALAAREERKPGRKLILWVSPGWPLLARPGVLVTSDQERQLFEQIATLSTQLRQARVTLYSIDPLGSAEDVSRTQHYKQFLNEVTKPSQAEPANLGLQVLATQTGGLVLSSNNDVAALLESAMSDSKAHYEISFNVPPGSVPDEYHRLEVQVAKPGFVARTRSGYYMQP